MKINFRMTSVTAVWSVFKVGSGYVAQAGLELEILLPLPPKCEGL
jgi:hypothetical protein